MTRLFCFIITPLVLILLGGCSQYIFDYQYSPRPGLADIPSTQPQAPPPVSVLATIVGIHRDDPSQGIPLSVEVRFQIENNGPWPVSFEIPSVELINGELLKFQPPLVSAPESIDLSPTQTANLNMFFPFPPGSSYANTNLESLQLRWRVKIDGTPAAQVIYFHRVFQDYYYRPYPYGYYGYPYPYPYGWYGGVGFGGVVVVHRR